MIAGGLLDLHAWAAAAGEVLGGALALGLIFGAIGLWVAVRNAEPSPTRSAPCRRPDLPPARWTPRDTPAPDGPCRARRTV